MNLAGVAFDIDFAIDRTSKSRKAALWNLAKRIGELRPWTSTNEMAKCLYARERLGTTAIGAGVAVPHTVLVDQCPPLILATQLEEKLDFDALDGSLVDILLGVVGNRDDLRWLQAAMPRFAKLAANHSLMHELRSATDVDLVVTILTRIGLKIAS